MKIKVIIIGAGITGMTVAHELLNSKAQNDKIFDIHVYQADNHLAFNADNIPYYLANEFKDLKLLNQHTKKDYLHKTNAEHKINIHLSERVVKIDPTKQLINIVKVSSDAQKKAIGKNVSYQVLVITTGALPKTLPLFNNGVLPHNVHHVISKDDAINLKKALKIAQKIVIVGSNQLALTMTETCLKLKKNVTIIEKEDRLMADNVDKEFSKLIYDELTGKNKPNKPLKTANYAKVLLNAKIDELMITANNVRGLRLIQGAQNNKTSETWICDLIILTTAVVPNTSFLQGSNIELTKDKAIIINEYCQVPYKTTENKKLTNIYSGGDCTEIYSQFNKSPCYVPLATNAQKMAQIIAKNIQNPIHKYPGTLGSNMIRIGNLEIAKTGLAPSLIDKKEIATIYIEDHDLPSFFSKSKPLFLKLFYHKTTFQLLGAQMAGYNHATLRINVLATAIWNKMDVRKLQNLDLAYGPSFAKINDIIHLASQKVK